MPLMKQIFQRVVIFFAALVVSAIVALIFLVSKPYVLGNYKDPGLDRESQLYADAAILAVVKTWDKDALMKRGSIELSAAARTQVDLDEVFERWRALGPMVKYNGSTGQANVTFSFETGKIVTALYVDTAVRSQSGFASTSTATSNADSLPLFTHAWLVPRWITASNGFMWTSPLSSSIVTSPDSRTM